MAYPIFTKGALSWTSERGNSFPEAGDYYEDNQIIDESIGGNIQVTVMGETKQNFYIRYDGISKTNYDDLIAFFTDSTVNFKKNTFTYTDELNNSYTVRLISHNLNSPNQVAYQIFSVSMQLRKTLSTE